MRLKVLVLAAIVAMCFVGMYTPQVMAGEGATITPFAEIKTWSAYVYKDKYANSATPGVGTESDTDFFQRVLHSSSFGIRGSWNGVTVTGSAQPMNRSNDYPLQLFIGSIAYKFGDIELVAGRTPTPYAGLDFNNVANWDTFGGYSTFDIFPTQIKLSVMGVYFMVMQPYTTEGTSRGGVEVPATYDVIVPKLALGYVYGNPGTPFSFDVDGLFQTYKIDDATNTLDGKRVNAYSVGGTFNMNGPVGFQVHAHYAVNPGNLGFVAGRGSYTNDAGDVSDSTEIGGHAGVYAKFGQMKVAGGFGYKTTDNDTYVEKDDAYAIYASLLYYPAPNFSIGPALVYEDTMKNSNDLKTGKTMQVGLYMSANI